MGRNNKTYSWLYLTLLSTQLLLQVSGAIVSVGNKIVGTTTGSQNDRTIYLFSDLVLQKGVLFGFSAFFRNTNPVMLQVWRPLSSGSNVFQLRKSWNWVPNVVHGREDAYLHIPGYSCFTVQPNDKIGLYQPVSPGSVAYEFNNDSPQSLTMQKVWTSTNTDPKAGDEVTFDKLTFPYKFSMMAYIDNDTSKYNSSENQECAKTLFIPDSGVVYSPKYLGPTGAMGSTGATGQRGLEGSTGPRGQQGSTGPKGPLGSQGGIGFTGHTGPAGPQGSQGGAGGTGSTGPIGATGIQGTEGEKGVKGDEGPQGIPGSPGVNPLAQKYEACPWCDKFMDAYVIMGLLVWLGVLTLVFFIYALVNCCCRSNRHPKFTSQDDLWRKYEKPGYENHYAEVEEGRTTF